EKEIDDIVSLWEEISTDYLALSGITGKKTEKEKFAGAEYTWAVEFATPNGRLVQGPDAHHDGQNFAKAFDIKFLDRNEKSRYVFQNTWAITTRMIGLAVMQHSDDKGLVWPPRIAPLQAVIIPIIFEDSRKKVMEESSRLREELEKDMAVFLDDRDGYTPGWKFNEWELKGVPLRIEIGPKDIEKGQAMIVRRDTGKKEAVKLADAGKRTGEILEEMQKDLLEKSRKDREAMTARAGGFDELKKAIGSGKIARAMWCGNLECEDLIKDQTGGAKIVTIPKDGKTSGKCVYCGKKAKHEVYIAKSY
ncbi:MAG: His/Gly/Thr/Pro-type tRNA ligase C-terminal domain-containing protein, partial [Candidatus Woesearchaeota archaeon]